MHDYIIAEFSDVLPKERYAKCGTAACIAGWTCILSMEDKEPEEIASNLVEHTEAGNFLELTNEQANRLFLPSQWPWRFLDGACDDGKTKTAKIAAARIEHFIKTKGKE
jgi:hypothetical protein